MKNLPPPKLLRLAILIICLCMFAWQVSKVIRAYLAWEIATKVESKTMDAENSQFEVAICLNQFNSMKPIFDETTKKELDLSSLGDMEWLQSHVDDFQSVYNASMRNISDRAERLFFQYVLLDDDTVTLSKYDYDSIGNVRNDYSEPGNEERPPLVDPPKLRTRFHPIFGLCVITKSHKLVENSTVSSVVANVQTDPGFFEDKTVISSFRDANREQGTDSGSDFLTSPLLELFPNLFQQSVTIIPHVERQLYSTGASVPLYKGAIEELFLHQDIADKRKVGDVEKCSVEPDHDEDLCLDRCLIAKFANLTRCSHPRLVIMTQLDERLDGGELRELDICDGRHYVRLLEGEDSAVDYQIDQGLSIMRKILRGFGSGDGDSRCGCPTNCVKRRLKLNRWNSHVVPEDQPESQAYQAVINVYQTYYSFEDSLVYDTVKLVSDIGGLVGLMMGYGLYSLADLIDFLWERRQKNKDTKV